MGIERKIGGSRIGKGRSRKGWEWEEEEERIECRERKCRPFERRMDLYMLREGKRDYLRKNERTKHWSERGEEARK